MTTTLVNIVSSPFNSPFTCSTTTTMTVLENGGGCDNSGNEFGNLTVSINVCNVKSELISGTASADIWHKVCELPADDGCAQHKDGVNEISSITYCTDFGAQSSDSIGDSDTPLDQPLDHERVTMMNSDGIVFTWDSQSDWDSSIVPLLVLMLAIGGGAVALCCCIGAVAYFCCCRRSSQPNGDKLDPVLEGHDTEYNALQ